MWKVLLGEFWDDLGHQKTRVILTVFAIAWGTLTVVLLLALGEGMKQRVIMCQLLLHNPDLILIDEPLVGLDPKTGKTVREVFIKLKEQGKTLFISTHTLSFAKDVASKIGIISTGELKFIGNLDELARISGKKDIEDIYLQLSKDDNGVRSLH